MIHYKLEGEKLSLFKGDSRLLGPLIEVGIAYDSKLGVLHKHGDPELVKAWAANFRSKISSVAVEGSEEMAEDLKVKVGLFNVDELNKCINIPGYVIQAELDT